MLLTEKQASSGGHVEWVSGAKFGYMGKAPPFGPGYMSPRVWHMTEHCRLNAVVKNLEEQVELLERHATESAQEGSGGGAARGGGGDRRAPGRFARAR